MGVQFFRFHGVKAEILEYLRANPEGRCTLTQMAKAEGLRKTPVSKAWLRKHLAELSEMGFVYSTKVKDPISKTEFTYYTIVPKCAEEGAPGIPAFMRKKQWSYAGLIQQFYSSLAQIYLPLISNHCGLCADFGKTLAKGLDCKDFIELYQYVKRNDTNRLKKLGITMIEIERLNADLSQWLDSTLLPPPLFLEDWTIALIAYTTSYGHKTACANCKSRRKCLIEGRKWVAKFLETYLTQTPKSGLKSFWENVAAGVPRIKTNLVQRYFAQRFNLNPDHNPLNCLEVYEEEQTIPYFYSKVLPLSLVLLIEDSMMPIMKSFAGLQENISNFENVNKKS